MKTSYIFLADGFEEVEALTCVDVMRRAAMPVMTVSMNPGLEVTGAHGVKVLADGMLDVEQLDDAEWLVLPGGIPGAPNLATCEPLCDVLVARDERGGKIAAICASPAVVLAPLGILQGREAVCYPGMEQDIEGVKWTTGSVAVDGHVLTGNGPAAASRFALAIVEQSMGHEVAAQVAAGMLLG